MLHLTMPRHYGLEQKNNHILYYTPEYRPTLKRNSIETKMHLNKFVWICLEVFHFGLWPYFLDHSNKSEMATVSTVVNPRSILRRLKPHEDTCHQNQGIGSGQNTSMKNYFRLIRLRNIGTGIIAVSVFCTPSRLSAKLFGIPVLAPVLLSVGYNKLEAEFTPPAGCRV